MATSMHKNSQEKKSTVGLLLIIGEIISKEQCEEICVYLKQVFKQINNNKYHEINDIFNNLIHDDEFQTDCQYRQIANTEHGSIAGFLYLPNFHTLLNVLKDLFNTCYHVCIIFCGQQIDFNGALILTDSAFTCENFHSLFDENPSYVIKDLEIILPFISNQWKNLLNNSLKKYLEIIQINDLSNEINHDNTFGQGFYEKIIHILKKDSSNFDIYTKLIPRDSSGTIAFDEPNLYILYGQQGEASLFGIRGFVVLINGGFSQIPSYWNLIRGLQNIDACILTHFDYDVLPGLQTILHRKTIPSSYDGHLCKPDIGIIFLNHIQRIKLQSILSKNSSLNNKLLNNLIDNIDQFLNDIKQLNINTSDLIKNKSNIEPINLYKKIAFGSLDLYILHPNASISEDDKILTNLQKIPIRNQQPSSSIIPQHHWYSSCSLLVWTPAIPTDKNSLVRILYTGACPQTLVFEALDKVRHLEFLHDSQQQQQHTTETNNIKTTSPVRTSAGVKHPPQKPKVSPPSTTNRTTSSAVQNKTAKVSSHSVISKPKVSKTTTIKSEKPRTAPIAKKAPPPKATSSARPSAKDKKTEKPRGTVSKTSIKPKEVKNQLQKTKSQDNHEEKLEGQNVHQEEPEIHHDHEQRSEILNDKHKEESETHNDHEQRLAIEHSHAEESKIHNDHNERPEIQNDYEQNLNIDNSHEKEHETHHDHEEKHEIQDGHEEELIIENEHEQNRESENEYEQNLETKTDDEQNLEIKTDDEQNLETKTDDEQNLEIHNHENQQSNEIQQSSFSDQNDNEEQTTNKNEHDISPDELNETSIDHHEDEIKQPESVLLTNDHNESSIDEIKSPLDSSHDPMTTSLIDENPNTQNPLTDQTNDKDDDDDEMEIIHHDISTSNKHPIPSDEEIKPQGLPVENNIHSKKSTIKKQSSISNRSNSLSTSANNINQASSQKFKQSDSIFNVDVAYIPYHGNEHYVDSEFFRRIRARYYILNAVQINRLTLESLIEGKQQWENKEHIPVTLVPTYDGEQLRQFFIMNKNRLAELNINILPASTRCNVQYDDEGTPAQLLRFNSVYNTDEQ